MALDAAEKMFFKIVVKNNLMTEADLQKVVTSMGESPTRSLPDELRVKGLIKADMIKKIVTAIEDKGQMFTKSLLNPTEEIQPNESAKTKPDLELSLEPVAPKSTGPAPMIQTSHAAPVAWQSNDDDDEFTLELPSVTAETVAKPIIIGQKIIVNENSSKGDEEIVYENEDIGLIPNPIVKPVGLGDQLLKFLEHARNHGASDFNLSVGSPPFIRKFGQLIRINNTNISDGQAEKMLMGILNNRQKAKLEKELGIDFSLATEKHGRFRANIIRQKNGWDGTFRVIPDQAPQFHELGLPPIVKRLTEFHQGLVLVTGSKGCGKTTTLAAMVDLINNSRKDHIITIEDPIEYLHPAKKCQVTQRALGVHTMSYGNALRGALREDPDIIMVGELRDLDTISASITAAETGHLVLASLHTTSAIRTVDRIIDSFPSKQQSQIRAMIGESIRGIICQQLLPRKDGKGFALALEILLNNISVRKHIVDSKTFQLDSVMQTSVKEGMIRMDDSINHLLKAGIITLDVAREFAREPDKIGV